MIDVLQTAHRGSFSSGEVRVTKWVEHVLGPSYHRYRSDEAWVPSINLYECKTAYWVVVDLAGVSGEAIAIRVEGGKMLISGERPTPALPEAQACMHLMEIDHGRFVRALELPDNADVDAIKATYRSGLLWVQIPKTA